MTEPNLPARWRAVLSDATDQEREGSVRVSERKQSLNSGGSSRTKRCHACQIACSSTLISLRAFSSAACNFVLSEETVRESTE